MTVYDMFLRVFIVLCGIRCFHVCFNISQSFIYCSTIITVHGVLIVMYCIKEWRFALSMSSITYQGMGATCGGESVPCLQPRQARCHAAYGFICR